MQKWVIEHHRAACIGCGACAAIEPKHWEMEGDKSHLKDSEKKEGNPDGVWEVKEIEGKPGLNQEAVDSCPVPCIFIKKVQE